MISGIFAESWRGRVVWYAGLVFTTFICLYVIFPAALVTVWETVTFAVQPTAGRAFEYGERHFSATNGDMYNIARAEYFFTKAADIDATTPYVYHELARIAFLRGNYLKALGLINLQISKHGETAPNSYYIRALIEGYMGRYDDAATDYEHYLQFDPRNWAALNDYAWVLLKAHRFQDAALATSRGLEDFPDNPWLLNSEATALYEMGHYSAALEAAQRAFKTAAELTEQQWLTAYPGNDPAVAHKGIATLQDSIANNIHIIEMRLASSAVQ